MAGIYVHVPFCHAKCAYCDFYSVARPEYAEYYAKALLSEFSHRHSELGGEAVETLYFGGGTPSLLAPDVFLQLAEAMYCEDIAEFTIEVNPEDVDTTHIAAWLKAGVNRVSIGVQSLNDTELKAVNRRHYADDALRAIALLQNSGITNISADLIYGLPGQTPTAWRNSLQRLANSGVKHISAYCLSYEEGTLLTKKLLRGDISEASEEMIEEYYLILCKELAAAGFEHYEISNFALEGYRSRHNSAYWRGVPYLGLGPGAHSLTAAGLRRYNPANLKGYISTDGQITEDDSETDDDRTNDLIMISLRTAEGLHKDELPPTLIDEIEKNAAGWLRQGKLIDTATHLRIPEHAWLLADAIIRDLFV